MTITSITPLPTRRGARAARSPSPAVKTDIAAAAKQRCYNSADGNRDGQKIVSDRQPQVLPHQVQRLREVDCRDHGASGFAKEDQIGRCWLRCAALIGDIET